MDQVEGLVEVLTIVPVLLDRREVRAYLGQPEGGFAAAGEPLQLPLSILRLEAGPPGVPALALTDDGVERPPLRPAADGGGLRFEPVIDDPPVLAGLRRLPGRISPWWRTSPATESPICCCRRPRPGPPSGNGGRARGEPLPGSPSPASPPRTTCWAPGWSSTPCPGSVDLDGDGRPDLLFRIAGLRRRPRHAARNLGTDASTRRPALGPVPPRTTTSTSPTSARCAPARRRGVAPRRGPGRGGRRAAGGDAPGPPGASTSGSTFARSGPVATADDRAPCGRSPPAPTDGRRNR